ncbi:hypothetical protein PPOP_1343, partial [Paenibacillus popilliae ATCC 14706]
GVVRTFILHESGHEPFVFLFPEGVALHFTIRLIYLLAFF